MNDRTFERAEASLAFLLRCLAAVLEDTGSPEVAAHLPWPERWRGSSPSDSATTDQTPDAFPDPIADRCVRAYSLAFTLLDQAEENATIQTLRALEDEGRMQEASGSWEQMFALLAELGFDEAQTLEALRQIAVEPVLTAHPTEAKRQTVLEHQRQLYRLLVTLENSMWSRAERQDLEGQVSTQIERLWRTGEIYLEKPSLSDERRMILHYLETIFPQVVERCHARLVSAWTSLGFDPAVLQERAPGPGLSFGNWVGGDRDGHPFVTSEFTEQTLLEFRRVALGLLDDRLAKLAARMSLSPSRQPTPEALMTRIEAMRVALGEAGERACARNRDEPWRQYANLLRAALPRSGPPREGEFAGASELAGALEELDGWLRSVGARRLAERDVLPVLRLVRGFGFHLARVDVRQNSAYHDEALAQLLELAGVEDGARFAEWGPQRRRAFVEAEVGTRRPLARTMDVSQPESKAMLDLYVTLSRHVSSYGAEGLGGLIVSMTRGVEDLLAVYVLAREGGLSRFDDDGAFLPLEVVPLFETIDDLERAPAIMEAYLSQPIVQRSLRHRARGEPPSQQVMVGYSDSCKDGGIVASMWSLHRCQDRLAQLGARHGVQIRFFHGRGGTIGRGAGPTHRFVRALPPGSLQSDLRVTEQGESIRQKLANPNTAAHHIELLQASALGRRALDRSGAQDGPELTALMDTLARQSRSRYVDLLNSEGFLGFFERATPIDAIENSRIGSRPARRKGTARQLSNLRAIPWVFAWNQARFVLPGWFGLGSALEALEPSDFETIRRAKRAESRWPPVHYLISNASTAWSTSSLGVMARYAELAEGVPGADAIYAQILDEHLKTGRAVEAIYGRPLALARPNIHRVLELRATALEPIHRYQVELLRRWRSARHEEAEALIPALLRTINAISAGLGATG